jgi:biopolymer transport protein ExbD
MEKTVLIKAVRSLSYGDMSDLIEVIKATGAGPIGLVTDSAGCSRVKAMKY